MRWGVAETALSSRVTPELCQLRDDITPELQSGKGGVLTNHMFKQCDGTLLFEGSLKYISK